MPGDDLSQRATLSKKTDAEAASVAVAAGTGGIAAGMGVIAACPLFGGSGWAVRLI